MGCDGKRGVQLQIQYRLIKGESCGTRVREFFPFVIVQVVLAVFAAQIAQRTSRSAPLFVAFTLIPLLGLFFFIYVMWSIILFVQDRLNELKMQIEVSRDTGTAKNQRKAWGILSMVTTRPDRNNVRNALSQVLNVARIALNHLWKNS